MALTHELWELWELDSHLTMCQQFKRVESWRGHHYGHKVLDIWNL